VKGRPARAASNPALILTDDQGPPPPRGKNPRNGDGGDEGMRLDDVVAPTIEPLGIPVRERPQNYWDFFACLPKNVDTMVQCFARLRYFILDIQDVIGAFA
jgi:hypothetical protein